MCFCTVWINWILVGGSWKGRGGTYNISSLSLSLVHQRYFQSPSLDKDLLGCEIKSVEIPESIWRVYLDCLWDHCGRGQIVVLFKVASDALKNKQILYQMRGNSTQTTKTVFVSVPICRDCLTNLLEMIRSLKAALIFSHGNTHKLPLHRVNGSLILRCHWRCWLSAPHQ